MSATLALYLDGVTPNDAPMNIQGHRILVEWAENLSWRAQDRPGFVDETNVARTLVPPTFGWYEWRVEQLVQQWLADPARTTRFGLMLKGNETPGRHIRIFWAKDCTTSVCSGKQASLTVRFAPPLPTSTPTQTPTSTPTPTPTSGIAALRLRSQPPGEIDPDQILTYTFAYQNGPYPLTNVVINNSIPPQMALITGSIRADPGIISATVGGKVFWTLTEPLGANWSGQVAYAVKRVPSLSATTPIVNAGAQITWQYQGAGGEMRSNPIRNPPLYLFLPMVVNTNAVAREQE